MLLFTACQKDEVYTNELKWPESEQTFYVSSDFHWQQENTNFRVLFLDETISALLSQMESSDEKTLLICGDITNGGKIEEHLEIASILKDAKINGVNIYVTMGNHDMDANLSTETIKEIYADFGFNQASYFDESTMSYLAKLNEELWLLSLDLNVYGDIESDMAGYISDETLLWVEDVLLKAEKSGAMVVPFSHHNLIEHAMEDLTHHYNIENGDKLKELLLKYSVPIYISGHRHSSFIASLGENERKVDELVVDMAASYPYRYNEITFNPDSTISYNTIKIDIENWAKQNDIQDETLLNFDETAKENFDNQLKGNAQSIDNLTKDTNEAELLKEYYIDVLTAQKMRTLWKYEDEFKNDKALNLWKKYADENIFGRWIPWILENQINDAENQILGPYR